MFFLGAYEDTLIKILLCVSAGGDVRLCLIDSGWLVKLKQGAETQINMQSILRVTAASAMNVLSRALHTFGHQN